MSARDKPIAPQSIAGLKPRMPFLHQLVQRHFPASKDISILDIGCGHGALIHVLNLRGYKNVRGVDNSIEQVHAAISLGINGVEQCDLFEALDNTQNGSLDVVVSLDVIEHYTKPELCVIIDKVKQVLKPSGLWIIHTTNGESLFAGRSYYKDATHETLFTRTSLCQFLKSSGFQKVYCFEDRPVPHGIKSFVRYLLWGIIRSMLLLYIAVETGELDRHAILSQNFTAVAHF